SLSKGRVEKAASRDSPAARPARPRRCEPPPRPSQRARPRFSQTALCNSHDEQRQLAQRPLSSPVRPATIQTSAPAPRRRRNQLTPLTASSHAHTARPSVKTARPTSCAVPLASAASPHPANASSSGGVGKCARGKRRRRVRELRNGKASRPAHLAATPKLGSGHCAHVRRPKAGSGFGAALALAEEQLSVGPALATVLDNKER